MGILKKMKKTYGGSIIADKDMLESTSKKYKKFLKNHELLDKAD
jgi:hypothetical protein